MKKIRKRKAKPPKVLFSDYDCPFCRGRNSIKVVKDNGSFIFNEFTACRICGRMYFMSVKQDGKLYLHLKAIEHVKDGKAEQSEMGCGTAPNQAVL